MTKILTLLLLTLPPADRASLVSLLRDVGWTLGVSSSLVDLAGQTNPTATGAGTPAARPIRHAIFEDNPPAPPR